MRRPPRAFVRARDALLEPAAHLEVVDIRKERAQTVYNGLDLPPLGRRRELDQHRALGKCLGGQTTGPVREAGG